MSDKRNKNTLFREKNIEKISSPEVLDEYLKVTSPGVWITLTAVIVLLVGVCIWGFFGNIDSHLKVAVVSDDTGVYCIVPKDAVSAVINNPRITIDGKEYEMEPETLVPVTLSYDTNVYVLLKGNLNVGDIVYQIPVKKDLKKDVYQGDIVTETLKPISLLFN